MTTQEQAIELLNAAKLAGDGSSKVDHLRSLMELVVRKEPALLPDFIADVVELQVDPAPAVKRFLAEFIDAAAKACPTPGVLQHSLACTCQLLRDEAAGTAKRALQSCYALFRTAYTLVAVRGASSDAQEAAALRGLWQGAQALRSAVEALAVAPGNDGVRTGAVKFLEQAVLLLTAERVPAVAGVSEAAMQLPSANVVLSRAALARDAEAALAQLVALLKQSGLAGTLAVAAVRAGTGIAQQRPQFVGRLMPSLLALAKQSGGDGAHTSSLAQALSSGLAALARSSHPSVQPWKKKVAAAMEAMGAQHALDPADRAGKRAMHIDDGPAKRPRLEHPAPQQPGLQGQAAPLPPLPAPGAATQAEPVPATPHEQLHKVLTVVRALVAAQDAAMLAGVVGSLQPGVLADVVLECMAALPPRHALPPEGAPLPAWVETLLDLVAAQAPLQLPAAGPPASQQAVQEPMPAEGQGPTQQQAAASEQPQLLPPPPPQPPAEQQEMQQQQAPPGPVQGGTPAAVAKASVPAPASFSLGPLPLTEQQQQQLCLGALLRILRTHKTSRQALRCILAAKLAAAADATVACAVMQQVVQTILGSSGGTAADTASGSGASPELEVALTWLDVLFARDCQPASADAATDGKGGAGPGGSHVATGGQGAARASPGADTGSLYERTLLHLLDGLSSQLPPSRLIVRVLLEAPSLPMPAVQDFLQRAVGRGGDWCTLGLLAARDVILMRPPSRTPLLQLVLDSCCAAASDTRSKAVRLVANRLFPEAGMAQQIEHTARQRLDALLPAMPAEAALRGQAPAGGATETKIEAAEEAFTAASAHESSDGQRLQHDSEQHEQQKQDATLQSSQPQQLQPSELQQQAEHAAATEAEGEPPSETDGPSDVEAAQLCALYCALCTKKHSLLRRLFEVYGQTSAGGRAAIQRNAGGLAKTLGASAPALLSVIQDPPAGSLPLVLQMLHVLTEAVMPPQLMVTACLQLYDRCKDARVLVPALRGLDRASALRLLPALLTLQPEQLAAALQRLVTPMVAPPVHAESQTAAAQAGTPVVSSTELLTSLHTLDHSKDAGLMRRTMQAVTVCISSPALFPPEALAACINQLMTRVPLPQLFMRTVIQTVAAAPQLRGFVVGILRQLASKQVWKDGTQWKGWIMCAQQTVPDSFQALVSLPADVLDTAIKALPDSIKQQLLVYAREGSNAIPSTTLEVLEQLQPQN